MKGIKISFQEWSGEDFLLLPGPSGYWPGSLTHSPEVVRRKIEEGADEGEVVWEIA